MKKYEDRAFPSDIDEGMTLRDYFAAMAMMGIHASYSQGFPDPILASEKAYTQAEAMLEERKKYEIHPKTTA